MENNDTLIGKFLDDRYEILEKIGSGGMAEVYKARCHRLNRLVAVKVLRDELANDTDFRRRFHAESQAVAMLSHPNIMSVYDVNHTNGLDYIVMELIEGITLKQYINRKGVLTWKEALHFTTQITKALKHAHSRGIIHRDIKPHNIMILKDGSVKVADFGIARLLTTQNTLTHEALGSVHYISPEQAKGGIVDARSDIYSVGVVMYEMLTNRLPFEGDSPVSVAIQHISSIPLSPRELNPEIPVGLEQIILHAMEPSVNHRYASADDLLQDLEEFRKNPAILFGYISAADAIETDVISQSTQVLPINSVNEAAMEVKKRQQTPPQRIKKPVKPADEYAKNRRKAGKTASLIGVFCVLAFLIFLFVFMWNYFLKDMLDPSEERVSIPSFVGSYVDEVTTDEQYRQYFNFTVKKVTSEHDEGYIISQDPSANRQMTIQEHGIDVELTVSSGPEKFYMPNLINKDYREAKIELDAYKLDLEIHIESVPDDAVTVGYVIDQLPKEGEELVEGGSVYITYSSGPEIILVEVPELVGYTASAAILRLQSKDLTYELNYVDDDAPKDEVIFQSYEAGEEVPIHTQVVLQVSNGPLEPDIPDPPVDDPVTPPDVGDTGETGGETGSDGTGGKTPSEPEQPVADDNLTPNDGSGVGNVG